MKIQPDEAGPRRLIGRASIVAAGTTYQQCVSLVSGLIVARVIGASDYGIFNLARNLLDLAAIVTRLGLDVGLQRHFGESNAGQDRTAHVQVLRRVRLLAGTFALLPAIAVALGLGRVVEANFYQYSHFAEILLCLALALPFLTDIAVLGGAYRGIFKLAPPVLAECVLLPTIRLSAILILFLAGWRLWAVVVGTTLGSLLASAFLATRARSDFHAGDRATPHAWGETFRVMRYSGVLAGVILVATLTASMDMLILGRFATAQDLGQYSLVKMLLVLMGVFGVAFGQGLGALVAERHVRADLPGMVHVMSLSTRLVTLLTLPVFAIFLLWGAQFPPLFGPSFVTSQAVVSWLAAGQYVFIIFGPSGWALSMTGKHVLELKILSIGLAVSALLCWIAIPEYGQLGAAVATFTSIAVANATRVLFVRRALGAFPFGADIIVITAAGIAMAWGCRAAIAQASLPPLWENLAGIGCFVLAYGVAGWTLLLRKPERTGVHAAFSGAIRKLISNGH